LRISEGPFSGYKAIYDERITGSERVRVLLEFLSGKHARLEIDIDNLEAISSSQ
jgi:hypothetical protein